MFFSRLSGYRANVILGIFTMLLISCGGSDDSTDNNPNTTPSNALSLSLIGSVKDSSTNQGLGDVAITLGNKTMDSSLSGGFQISNATLDLAQYTVVTAYKKGYAKNIKRLLIPEDGILSVNITLTPAGMTQNLNMATSGAQTVSLSNPGNANNPTAIIDFPPAVFGSSGTFDVEVTVGDPTIEAGQAIFPGDYIAANEATGEADTLLESLVFTDISVTNNNGTEVTQLAQAAVVRLRLPDNLQSSYSVGDQIPWWSLDESKGIWVREDADTDTVGIQDAKIVTHTAGGDLYAEAKITHLSWWNVDKPITSHACVCATVVDTLSNPLANIEIVAKGSSYTGRSSSGWTDKLGYGCVTVLLSENPAMPETVDIFANYALADIGYNVLNSQEGIVSTSTVYTPTQAGSTIGPNADLSQCIDLEQEIVIDRTGVVQGTAFYEGANNLPAANIEIITGSGATYITDTNGYFSIPNLAVGAGTILFMNGFYSYVFVIAADNNPFSTTIVLPNRPPVITSVQGAPTGVLTNGQVVSITALASDGDGDPVSYAWSLTGQGAISATAGTNITFTAPATGSGSSVVTLSVADNKGAVSSHDITLDWGNNSGSQLLKYTFLDNPTDLNPVPGVIVSLYAADQITIATTLVSGSNGVVDFGDINAGQATVSIIEETVITTGDGSTDVYSKINTFVDISVSDQVVYVDNAAEYKTLSLVHSGIGHSEDLAERRRANAQSSFTVDFNASGGTGSTANPPYRFINENVYDLQQNIFSANLNANFLQSDGLFSPLVTYVDNSYSIISYGFLHDQMIPATGTFNITVDQMPDLVPIGVGPDETFNAHIVGFRKNTPYVLRSKTFNTILSNTDLQLPSAFQFDHYWVRRSSDNGQRSITAIEGSAPPVTAVSFDVPDFDFTAASYDATAHQFQWQSTGTTAPDFFAIHINDSNFAIVDGFPVFNGVPSYVSWNVWLPTNKNVWKIPNLPTVGQSDYTGSVAEIDDTLTSSFIMMVNFDFIVNYDNLWEFLSSGDAINERLRSSQSDKSLIHEGGGQ